MYIKHYMYIIYFINNGVNQEESEMVCRLVPFSVLINERGVGVLDGLRLLFLFVCKSVGIDKVGW